MKLESSRLLLRPFELDDAAVLIKLAGNWEVSKTSNTIPYPYQDHHATDWIAKQKVLLPQAIEIALAMETKAVTTDKLIGCVSLFDIEEGCAEIGYWVGEPYWGQGYASEATEQIINFAFDILRLKKIEGWCLKDNPASAKVMEKNGFKFSGEHSNQVQGRHAGKILLKYEAHNTKP